MSYVVCVVEQSLVTESKEYSEFLIGVIFIFLCRDQQPSVTHRKPWTVNEQELFEQGLVSFYSKHMIVILITI